VSQHNAAVWSGLTSRYVRVKYDIWILEVMHSSKIINRPLPHNAQILPNVGHVKQVEVIRLLIV